MNFLLVVLGIVLIKVWFTVSQSNGKCWVLHDHREVPPKRKWQRGDPLRVGGFIEHKCTKCNHTYVEKWSAF